MLHVQLVNEASSVCIHIAERSHHVVAVRQIDNQIRTASRLDAVCPMIVYFFIAEASEIPTKSKALHPSEERRVLGKQFFKWAMPFACLAHQNASGFLQYLRFDNSGLIPEVSDSGLAGDHCFCCLSVAVWA